VPKLPSLFWQELMQSKCIIDAFQVKSILKLISHEFCFIIEITLDFHLLEYYRV